MFSKLFRSSARALAQPAARFGVSRSLAFSGGFAAAALMGVSAFADSKPNYDAIRKAIADNLDQPGYDDGSIGPVLVRLAWHASGTYDKADGSGGSSGAKMRYEPEAKWGANAGLEHARAFLEPIKEKYPDISYADLWTLAGTVAIEEMGGPKLRWTPGRTDDKDGKLSPADGRLPDAAQGAKHIRDIFYRMGFNDKEIVALVGAHCLGRCHTDRSGFSGPWTRAPTTFSNLFFVELVENKWEQKKWNGPKQFADPSGDLMMLPADLALRDDPEFRKHVDLFAKDEKAFFDAFASAWPKLMELGTGLDKSGGAAPPPKAAAASGSDKSNASSHRRAFFLMALLGLAGSKGGK
jgi:catalase (peroxidase I)